MDATAAADGSGSASANAGGSQVATGAITGQGSAALDVGKADAAATEKAEEGEPKGKGGRKQDKDPAAND